MGMWPGEEEGMKNRCTMVGREEVSIEECLRLDGEVGRRGGE